MLDMKLTILCAELPLILLLVVLVAFWIVQMVLSRRAQESATEQPAVADAAPQASEAYQEEPPVEESQPEEEEVAAAADYVEEVTEEAEEEPEEQAEEQPEQQPEESVAEGAAYSLTDNSVVFERGDNAKQTWNEKYESLEEDQRKMLDKLFAYVAGNEGVRRLDLTSNVRMKYKTHELFKADIKRGVPVISFMLSNTSLMRYVKESGTKKIKITPVTVKLNDNDDLQLALHTADMALEQAKSEEEFKKERRKEQRRERQQQAKRDSE